MIQWTSVCFASSIHLSLPPQRWLPCRKRYAKCVASGSRNTHLLLTDKGAQREFLQTAWGVKPVLFRNLFPGYKSPVTGDDLAALSSDASHYSRLVMGANVNTMGNVEPYTQRIGPFDESIWATLPSRGWTLLVQGLERSVTAASDLLDAFTFLPNWRADDVQASYAVPDGGVGPHVDNYDVFLVQAAGTRRWCVSHTPIPPESEHLIPGIDVRVLRDEFPVDGDYVLYPGDALYVPPRFPHHGVSLDTECITLSVGFRAPTASFLLSRWVEHLVRTRRLTDTIYTDNISDLVQFANDPGRITSTAADKAFDLLTKSFKDNTETRREFATWFAREISQTKTFTEDYETVERTTEIGIANAMRRLFGLSKEPSSTKHDISKNDIMIRQRPGSVFAYREDEQTGSCYMCIDGDEWAVDHSEIAKTLCRKRCLTGSIYRQLASKNKSFKPIVARLLKAGLLYIDDGGAREEIDVHGFDDDDKVFQDG